MKPLRQASTRPIISYTPRVEPAPPKHAARVEGFNDVYILRGDYVAFIFSGDSFLVSPSFTTPESARRWAEQVRREREI